MWFESAGNLEVRQNSLYIGGVKAEELARKYGTPLYVYNSDRVIENFQRLNTLFKEHSKNPYRIHFAVKANTHPQILSILNEQGAWVDAVSPQEVMTALKARFPKERILFTGTSVSNLDLKQLISLGVSINVDSFSQLERLAALKPDNRNISFRWNPGEGAGHHGHTITAGKFIKFGIPEHRVDEFIDRALELGFNLVGLHQHIGSGWLGKDVELFLETVQKTIEVAKKIEGKTGKPLDFVDFGGGPGIPYKASQQAFPLEEYVKGICERMASSGLDAAIAIEPGRFIVGDAGILLVEVNTVEDKNIPVLGVDAGFTTLVRPAFYGSYHEVVVCNNVGAREKKGFMVAGNLCETGDVFNTNTEELRELPIPKEGDILALLCAGAYGYTMTSNYNSRPKPAEVIITKARHYLITDRQGFEDVVKGQKIVF